MNAPAPLAVAELAAVLEGIGGFEQHPFIAVAVSGGPDSMALAILADRWARERGGIVQALTVDHRLRPESAAEARQVGGWLAAHGIPHEVLAWEGTKPSTGIQEAAREARYDLLTGWCRQRGCLHLLTAHHREDQAETYLIRRRARSGPDGLAGMSAVRELSACRIVRPLLGVSRTRLTALLRAEGQAFVTDPSNQNPIFERGRLREDAVSAFDDAAAHARNHGLARARIERQLDGLLARAVSVHPAGFAALDLAPMRDASIDLSERLLGRIAATIGGTRYPLRHERVARLLKSLIDQPERARTLGGCRFAPWRGRVLVLREAASAALPQRIQAGETIQWDRRFEVTAPQSLARPVTIGYLGTQRPLGRRGQAILPRLVHSILPAVRDESGVLAVPHIGYAQSDGIPVPRIAFRPANRLSQAGFTVV